MKVPRYYSQGQQATARGPLASGSSPQAAALQNVGAGIQDLGFSISDYARKRQEKRNFADVTNGMNALIEESIGKKAEIETLKGVDALDAADRYKTWFNEASSRIRQDYLHNPESQEAFNRQATDHYLGKIAGIASYQAKQESFYRDSVLAKSLQNLVAEITADPFGVDVEDKLTTHDANATILKGGAYTDDIAGDIEAKIKAVALRAMVDKDPVRAEAFIEKWKGDIGPDAYKKFKDAAKEVANKQAVEAVYSVAMGQSLELGEKTIKGSDIPSSDKQRILGYLRAEKQIQEKEAKDIQEAGWDKETLSALQEIGTLTFDQINKLNTSDKDKQMLTNKVVARGDKIKKTGKDPVEEHDPKYLSDLNVKINTAPDTVDIKKDIWNKAGDGKDGGITADQARVAEKRLTDRLKETPRGRSIKQGEDYLTALKSTEFFGEKNTIESVNNLSKWQETYNAYIEKNPDDNEPYEWLKKQLNADVNGFWSKVADTVIGAPGRAIYDWTNPEVTPSESDAINKGTVPETLKKRFNIPNPDRDKAAKILKDAGKQVNEASIKYVMDNM